MFIKNFLGGRGRTLERQEDKDETKDGGEESGNARNRERGGVLLSAETRGNASAEEHADENGLVQELVCHNAFIIFGVRSPLLSSLASPRG